MSILAGSNSEIYESTGDVNKEIMSRAGRILLSIGDAERNGLPGFSYNPDASSIREHNKGMSRTLGGFSDGGTFYSLTREHRAGSFDLLNVSIVKHAQRGKIVRVDASLTSSASPFSRQGAWVKTKILQNVRTPEKTIKSAEDPRTVLKILEVIQGKIDRKTDAREQHMPDPIPDKRADDIYATSPEDRESFF